MVVQIALFNGFQTLDVFGPVEALGAASAVISERNPARSSAAAPVTFRFSAFGADRCVSAHGVEIHTLPIVAPDSLRSEADRNADPVVLLIPGGNGTRREIDNGPYLNVLGEVARASDFVLTVCTGAALLAKTGLLDGLGATTNKRAFAWVMTTGPAVRWVKRARWVVSGNIYTSSGVSAGIDMAFAFARDRYGDEVVRAAVSRTEYVWNDDPRNDPFAIE